MRTGREEVTKATTLQRLQSQTPPGGFPFETSNDFKFLTTMHAGNPDLVQFIRAAIRRDGPVTFAWFMEQALYHPQLGYYSSGRCEIGRWGDYFTNVSVGRLFGRVLAAQFAEMWLLLERPDPFTIVEQGAHHGDLAKDVLEVARETEPEFFGALRYCIVEPFPILRSRQGKTLGALAPRVWWRNGLDEREPFCG